MKASTFRSRGRSSRGCRGRGGWATAFDISGRKARRSRCSDSRAAVEVEGYLVAYRLEIPEPPNCYSRAEKLRDFHLWLSEHEHDVESNSIVVEITPRVRASHPEWEDDRLAALAATQAHIRIRGWLMLDQMHPENVGRNRATLWEVHPILQIAWRSSHGKWIPLDSLSPSADNGLLDRSAR